MSSEQKVCKLCCISKPTSEYSPKQLKCKQCRNAAMKEYNLNKKQPGFTPKTKPIKIAGNTVIECECGSTYTLWNKTHHMQSYKHINAMNQNETTQTSEPVVNEPVVNELVVNERLHSGECGTYSSEPSINEPEISEPQHTNTYSLKSKYYMCNHKLYLMSWISKEACPRDA